MKVILTMIIISVACVSCRNPEEQPELRDPIYQDLQKRLELAEKDVKAATDEHTKIEAELPTLNQQTGEYKARWRDFYTSQKTMDAAEQKANYYKMSVDSRKKEARLSYLKYFKDQKENDWPNPDEFARYQSKMNTNEYLKGGHR